MGLFLWRQGLCSLAASREGSVPLQEGQGGAQEPAESPVGFAEMAGHPVEDPLLKLVDEQGRGPVFQDLFFEVREV
jgi:hypothetical protein